MTRATDTALPSMFPVGVLAHAGTGRLHPVIFYHAPLPSGADVDSGAARCYSLTHHTEGFADMSAVEAYVAEFPRWRLTGARWSWDGSRPGCMTHWFAASELGAGASA